MKTGKEEPCLKKRCLKIGQKLKEISWVEHYMNWSLFGE